jgi:hypothetical protein
MSHEQNVELIRSYASAGIAAAVAINSGALIAVLSQMGDATVISPLAGARAMTAWMLGVAVGVLAWPAAYLSVSHYAHGRPADEVRWANISAGLALGSVVLFGLGFIPVVWSIARGPA